jgi:hypothetical protein
MYFKRRNGYFFLIGYQIAGGSARGPLQAARRGLALVWPCYTIRPQHPAYFGHFSSSFEVRRIHSLGGLDERPPLHNGSLLRHIPHNLPFQG